MTTYLTEIWICGFRDMQVDITTDTLIAMHWVTGQLTDTPAR